MRIPTVHGNGDSKRTLLEDNLRAHTAIVDAITAVARAAPNGRNFYVNGAYAIQEAMEEHFARLARLNVIREEYETILEGIEAQGK